MNQIVSMPILSKVEHYFGSMEIENVVPAEFKHQEWYDVSVDGEKYSVWAIAGDDFGPAFLVAHLGEDWIIPPGAYEDVYDAAAAWGKAVMMGNAMDKVLECIVFGGLAKEDESSSKSWAQEQARMDAEEYAAAQRGEPSPHGWGMVEGGFEDPCSLPMSEEEEAIPAEWRN